LTIAPRSARAKGGQLAPSGVSNPSGEPATGLAPCVSVIVACYNQPRFVGDAIRSVLEQTFTDLELIVVDDGSTDSTPETIAQFKDPRLRYIRQDNRGTAAARNTGFRASRGRYINFLDGDDYFGPEKLSRQVAALEAGDSFSLAFCDIAEVDADGNPASGYSVKPALGKFAGDLLPILLAGGFAPPHAFLVRREALETVGLFDETGALNCVEDYDLWLRIAASGYRACYVDAKDAFYRIHSGNLSLQTAVMDAGRREALRRVAVRFPERVGAALAEAQDISRQLFRGVGFLQQSLEAKNSELERAGKEMQRAAAEAAKNAEAASAQRLAELSEQVQRLQQLLDEALAAPAAAEQLARDPAVRAAVLKARAAGGSSSDSEAAALQRRVSELEAQVSRQSEREQRLRAELDRTWVRMRELAAEAHNRRLSTRLKKRLHGVLDAVQAMTPEAVRAAARPVYLRAYRAIFPQGKREFLAPPPRVVQAVVHPAPAPAAPRLLLRRPLISVVLPVWNHGRFLAQSIASVLDQSYSRLELIVVDDGSTEDLSPVLARFSDSRLRYFRKPHSGVADTLNAGFRRARGEFLTWTSADNAMQPRMLETLLDYLLRHPGVDMVYGDMELMDERGEPLRDSDYRVSCQRPEANHKLQLPRALDALGVINDNFIGACFLYRRGIAQIVGEYDSSLLGTEDYDYWLRMSELGTMRHVDSDECLYRYRVHDETLSARHGASEIFSNAERLIELHRERAAWYAQPFSVFVLTDSGSAMPPENVAELAAAFRVQGHHVFVAGAGATGIAKRAGVRAIEAPLDDAAALCRILSAEAEQNKAIVVSLARKPVLAEVARAWASETVLYCDWLPEGIDAAARLETFPREKPLWLLCGSAAISARLPEPFARAWSLMIAADAALPERVALARKARDNNYVPHDFPASDAPAIVFVGPVSESALDFDAIRAAVSLHPDKLFVFVDTGSGSVNPRDFCPGAENLHWLDAKRHGDVHLYLSRAALLIAPFRDAASLARVMTETLSVYLGAGRPILATRAIVNAGFEDAPGLLMCGPSDFAASIENALAISPDHAAADEYLRVRSPEGVARAVAAAAISRLYSTGVATPRASVAAPRAGAGRSSEAPAVLIETRTLDRGGLERVVADMALALRERGFRVAIAVTERDGRIGAECRAAGLTVYAPVPGPDAFGQCLEIEQPDLVISHYSTVGAPVAAARGIPVIDILHNAYIWASPAEHRAISANAAHVSKYVAVSEFVRRYAVAKYGIAESRIVVAPNGIDTDRLMEAASRPPHVTRESLGIDPRAYVFLQVASLYGTKAQAHSISAMARIARQYPHARLVLVGSQDDRAYTEFVRQHIRRLGVEDRVLVCGETDSITDYYKLADAFLLSSLTEGWSLAMNEAMLLGLPMILTAVGGAPETIEGGDIGLLVPAAYSDACDIDAARLWKLCTDAQPPNLDALASAMVRFCAAPEEWRERGRRGTEKVLERDTAAAATARLMNVIAGVLQQRGALRAQRAGA